MANTNFKIPLETFYIMVAQKLGGTASPTMARRYGEAIQEVIYEQLNTNDVCYWYGFGNFEKSISSYTGQYKEVQNFGTGRRETMFIEPKYILGFNPRESIVEALNNGEEKIPRYKYKKKYNIRPKEYQEIRNERRRKEVQPLNKIVDKLLADVRYEGENDGKED